MGAARLLRVGAQATLDKAELLAPGARIGRYHLLRRLAMGGMAELHLACAEGLAGFQKVVVLKRVLPHLAADPSFVELFTNEARLAANLDHPNLVQVMDIGEADGDYFYVMEYVHGRNARQLLAAAAHRGGMPLSVALQVAVSAAAGLHHAHERTDLEGRPLGLVHRDVSPANVLISYDGAVKVTDFGIAKASARSTETIGGSMKGKIGYMSPEQCRGEPVDRRSDVFGLGILLYELTTTERLFFADNDFAVLNKVINGRFTPPAQRVPDYPPALERIVMRALAGTPEQRYPTAQAVLRDLETFAHEARLRCTPAAVADWMLEEFGQPPFPRVEVRPAGADDPLETIPTLVLVGDTTPGADPAAPTRAERGGTSPMLQAPPPVAPRRSRGPTMVGSALLLGALAAGGTWMLTDATPATPAEQPPAVAADADPAADAAPDPTANAHLSDDPATPTEPPAVVTPAPSSPAETTRAPRTPPASKPRRRSKAKRPKPRPSATDDDPNTLYPIKVQR